MEIGSSSAVVRPFAGGDVAQLISVWNAALKRDPINEARFLASILGDPDLLPGPDSGLFVAGTAPTILHVSSKHEVVGFIRAILRRYPNDRVGLEPELGYLPLLAVHPEWRRRGTGSALLKAALAFFQRHGRRRIWVCGNSGSAPGYLFPGVDKDAYPAALALLQKHGFVPDHEAASMLGELTDFDRTAALAMAGLTAPADGLKIETLSLALVPAFFEFLATSFPGDWNIAARAKVRAGLLHEVLIARTDDDEVIGYCQWEGEHFGPFGVAAAHRNRRAGSRLFIEALHRIKRADGRTVWFNWADPYDARLPTLQGLTGLSAASRDAARFYARFGLHVTRRFVILRNDLERSPSSS